LEHLKLEFGVCFEIRISCFGFKQAIFPIHNWMLEQCLDSGVSSIQPFDLYTNVSTNQMHYAWQAGVRPARNALKPM
jgi:hypothetical protein